VRGQGAEVVIQAPGQLVSLGVVDPGHQWRVFNDPALPVTFAGEPGKRPVAGPAAGTSCRTLDLGSQRLARCALPQMIDVDALVGPGQERGRGQVSDLGAVPGDTLQAGKRRITRPGRIVTQ
jgi:hypothetical protein